MGLICTGFFVDFFGRFMGHLYDIFPTAQTDNFFHEVLLGNIPGHYGIRKFFNNPDMIADQTVDLWDFGVEEPNYTYTAATGADYYVCSDNNGDNQIIKISILDELFNPYSILVQMQGQTPVKVNNPNNQFLGRARAGDFKCTRVHRMENESSINFAGQIYCVEGDAITNGVPDDNADVRAYVNNGNNLTLMSQFTIPAGFYGALVDIGYSLTKKQTVAVDITYWERKFGKVFAIKDTTGLNTIGSGNRFVAPVLEGRAEPKTDIVIRGNADAVCGAGGFYSIILVEARYVNQANNQIVI